LRVLHRSAHHAPDVEVPPSPWGGVTFSLPHCKLFGFFYGLLLTHSRTAAAAVLPSCANAPAALRCAAIHSHAAAATCVSSKTLQNKREGRRPCLTTPPPPPCLLPFSVCSLRCQSRQSEGQSEREQTKYKKSTKILLQLLIYTLLILYLYKQWGDAPTEN
jgi:hypothetical protein